MAEKWIAISLCYSPVPRQLLEKQIECVAGKTATQMLDFARTELCWDMPGDVRLGVWNKALKDSATYVLQDGDRLEIYRTLRVDPMTARRERFKTQGARSAGLFAQRRPGAKPGY
jgi:putative ubiquitin-RnfH superfamily antitoxin RatB of RatAB toxin-antitoxin module